MLSDSPESADTLSFPVQNGDVILAATDGVFDNVPTDLLLDILKDVSNATISRTAQGIPKLILNVFLLFFFFSAKAKAVP